MPVEFKSLADVRIYIDRLQHADLASRDVLIEIFLPLRDFKKIIDELTAAINPIAGTQLLTFEEKEKYSTYTFNIEGYQFRFKLKKEAIV